MAEGFFKDFKSYFFPRKLRSVMTPHNPVMELWYHRGQYVLSTDDAVYSDGSAYRPVSAAFKMLGSKVYEARSVLLLGSGLASTLHILAAKNCFPDAALVDVDETVLAWAQEFLPEGNKEKTIGIQESAQDFIAKNELQFDIVVSDVFSGKYPLPFVATDEYLGHCRDAVAPGGFFILNYITYDEEEAQALREKLGRIFGKVPEKNFDFNYVFAIRV